MRVINSEHIQWHTGPGHREPGIFLRDLLTGNEGEANNYWLVMVRIEGKYDTPPHHHNFEQVRVMLEGRFNFGPQDQEEGTIGYFCEGTTYEQQARGHSRMLLLQCEGGSRSRYLSQAEMRRAVHGLKQAGGRFEDGYFVQEAEDGTMRKQDSVEALWEHATGQKAIYAEPRYQTPVIMDPSAFAKVPITDGVAEKPLGEFGERRLAISMLYLEPGTEWTLPALPARQLLFVRSGSGLIDGTPFEAEFAIEVDAGERPTIDASEPIELLRIALPR